MADRKTLHQAFSEPRTWDYQEETFLGSMLFTNRMGLFVLLGLLALAATGGVYYLADRTLSAASDRLATANRLAEMAATVEKKAWQLRNDEKYFLLGKGSQYVASHEAGVKAVSGLLNILYGHPDTEPARKQITTINEGLAQYTEEFVTLVTSQKKTLGRLDDIFAYLVPSLVGLSDFAEGLVAIASSEERKARTFVRLLLPGSVAALLLMVTLFGHVLMRGFTAPVRAVADATRKLSEGEQGVAIPVLGNRDELGQMARALTGIKAKLSEAALLHGELEAARAEINDCKAAAAETEWLRKDKETVQAEVEKLQGDLEAARADAERGEAASIESALLRIDLEATKADLEKSEAAAKDNAARGDARGLPGPGEEARREPEELAGRMVSGSISTISRQVTHSSQVASTAAYEAERTGALINGLTRAADKIGEVENLLATIGEQTEILIFRPEPKEGRGEDPADNLVQLTSEYRTALEKADRGDNAIGRRFDSIRSAASQVTWAIRDIAETIDGVKEIAVEIATTSSAEALRVTTELLEQSEHLREMLDNLVSNVTSEPEAPPATQSDRPDSEYKPPSQA